ncbi:tyrosine/lipid phosphatase LipA [Nocardia sp. JMUB6875]|uniref:tyrosine-protein phosphatase n=1 Tax=Nocardia sp. JMUB6875 TaxID=3158170 RepID=UPI0032E7D3D3
MLRSRGLRLALSFSAAVAVSIGAAGTASAVEAPTPTSAVVIGVDERALPLPGVENARDTGGYRTTDGKTVRTGLVFRTGELGKASDQALSWLTDHNLRFDEDLRTSYEIAMSPDRVPAGAVFHNEDVIGQAPPQVVLSTFSAGTDLYRAFITTPGANQGFAQILRDIIDTTDGTVLFHCTAGKDRTGWMAAVMLTILGVDRDTVYYDYLLSNYYRNAAPGDALNGVVSSALDAAFDQANQSYGSFDGYVHNGLGLSDSDIAALKAKMLS